MRRAGGLVCVLLLVIVAAVGCGGSETKTETVQAPTTSSAKLTRAQFLAKLDALCKYGHQRGAPFDKRVNELEDRLNSSSGQEQRGVANDLAAVLRDEARATQPVLDRAHALKPPKSEQGFYNAYVDIAEQGKVLAGQFADALESFDSERITDVVNDVKRENAKQNGLLIGHGGLPNCHRD